jgi:hypothetical protein
MLSGHAVYWQGVILTPDLHLRTNVLYIHSGSVAYPTSKMAQTYIAQAPPPAAQRAKSRPSQPEHDARRRKRLKIALPVHVRPFDARYAEIEDVGEVIDFTRDGLFFRTCMPHYFLGMRLIVTFPYGEKISAHRRMLATVVRMDRFEDGSRGVAVRVLL